MPLPAEIINSLGFLVTKTKVHKRRDDKYEGTAFFVSAPSSAGGEYLYLVTAKHVIEGARKEGRSTFYLRLNTTSSKRDDIKLIDQWMYSKNVDVDVAVMPMEWLDAEYFNWAYIKYAPLKDSELAKRSKNLWYATSNMFADEYAIEAHSFGIGDEVRVVGLFSEHTGKERNITIARSGIIAAMPDEPLEVVIDGKKRSFNAYLVEVRSIGGLSGSPVYVLKEKFEYQPDSNVILVPTSEYAYFLLGMIRGHWDYQKQFSFTGAADKEMVNMGMAYVTPVQDLIDVLYGAELMAQRKRDDEQTLPQCPAVATEKKTNPKLSELT